MKTKKQFYLLALSLLIIVLIRCTPNQDLGASTKEIISQGKWSASYFITGQNNSSYGSQQFTFAPNGTFICIQGNTTSTGTWNIIHDVKRNEILILNINSQIQVLNQLNAQWKVGNKNLNEVNLDNGQDVTIKLKKQ